MSPIATATKLPEAKEVRDLLTDLLDKPIDLALGAPFSLEDGEKATYAVYVDDRLGMRAVAVADLPLAGYAGGALGLTPAASVQEDVKARALPESLEENFYEVLNICAALMNAEGMPHIKLHAVHRTTDETPMQVKAMTMLRGRRIDLDVTVGGYGKGRFSLVVIA